MKNTLAIAFFALLLLQTGFAQELPAHYFPSDPLHFEVHPNPKQQEALQDRTGSRRFAFVITNYDPAADTITLIDSTRVFYNSANLPSEEIDWKASAAPYVLLLSSRTLYDVYDTRDSLIHRLDQIWQNSTWEDNSQFNVEYNANGNITTFLLQQWSGSNWDTSYLSVLEYNANNQVISNTDQYSRTLYEYDANGYNTVYTKQNRVGMNWVNRSRSMQSFNGSGKVTTLLTQKWVGNYWVNDAKFTFTYDANNHVVNRLNETWDGTQWKNDFLLEATYYPTGQLNTYLFQKWTNNTWVSYTKTTYAYNTENQLLTVETENWINSAWHLSARARYYYETINGSQNPSTNADLFTIYPNPATNYLTLKTKAGNAAKANIFDMQGRLQYQQVLHGAETESISLSGIPRGEYILQILGKDGNITTRRLIIAN